MGKYETAVPLGRGAMGEVFKAFDPALQRFVALKYLRWADGDMAERLMREARLQARVQHELVCKVYEVGVDEGRPFIAMQYIDGKSLEDAAASLSLDEKLRVMRDVARAVHAAHETGLVHRDLKPQNILLQARPEGEAKPFVLDFGLAREREAPGLTESGRILGTPAYMAPEQARGELDRIDRRTDVYALGAVLYRLVTGRPPFEGPDLDVAMRVAYAEPTPPRRIAPELPAAVEAMVLKCLEKEPVRRYDSAEALAQDMERFLAGQPVSARAPGLPRRVAARLRRNVAATTVAAVALVLVASLGGVALRQRWDERERAAAAMRLGQEAAEIEGSLRQAYLLPLHDVRPETALVRRRMRSIETELQALGPRAEGPGRYALGRAWLALHRYEPAQAELERAWRAGYRTAESAQSLGQALGERYQRALERAQRIGDRATRESRTAQVEKAFREPAFEYLRAAGASSAPSAYVVALAAFYAKRPDEAKQAARRAYQEAPGLYEARVLEADVVRLAAQQRYAHGEYEQALADYQAAWDLYARAIEIARSDALVYERQCDCGLGILEARTRRGLPAAEAFTAALAACDAAVGADSERAEAHSARAALLARRGSDWSLSADERHRLLADSQASAESAVRADPRDPEGFRHRGVATSLLAQLENEHGGDPRPLLSQAVESYETALRLDPGLIEVYQGLGNAYVALGQYQRHSGGDPRDAYARGVAAYEKAAESGPGSAAAYNALGIAYKEAAQFETDEGRDPGPLLERAAAAYRTALAANPRYVFALANLGNARVLQAERELLAGREPGSLLAEARRFLGQAVAIDPQASFYVDFYLGHGEIVAARRAMGEGSNPEPGFRAAEAALRRSVAANPELAESREWLAQLYRWRAEWRAQRGLSPAGEARRGLRAAREAARLDPGEARDVALQGLFHAIEARQAATPGARAQAAAAAAETLRRAFGMNALLCREFGPILAQLDAGAGVEAAEARR